MFHYSVENVWLLYFVSNMMITVHLLWIGILLFLMDGTLKGFYATGISFLLTNIFTFFVMDRPGRFYVNENGITDFKKDSIVDFGNVKSIVLTIGYQEFYVHKWILERTSSPYRTIKEGKKIVEWLPRIWLYDCNAEHLENAYEGEMHDVPIDKKPVWSTIPYRNEAVRAVLSNTVCPVYIARSYLVYNQWTINRFSHRFQIPIERIRLIIDGKSNG